MDSTFKFYKAHAWIFVEEFAADECKRIWNIMRSKDLKQLKLWWLSDVVRTKNETKTRCA